MHQLRRKLSVIGLLAAVLAMLAGQVWADTFVRGYTRKDGTYVQPHYRSNPDGNRFNNYSTQGNTNPYTGRAGTVNPYVPSYRPAPVYNPPTYDSAPGGFYNQQPQRGWR
jgi:hypothetical protein